MDAMGLIFLGAVGMLALMALALRFAGFGAQRPADYADAQPPIDLREHL